MTRKFFRTAFKSSLGIGSHGFSDLKKETGMISKERVIVVIYESKLGYRQERKRIIKKEERSNETVQSARVRDRQ